MVRQDSVTHKNELNADSADDAERLLSLLANLELVDRPNTKAIEQGHSHSPLSDTETALDCLTNQTALTGLPSSNKQSNPLPEPAISELTHMPPIAHTAALPAQLSAAAKTAELWSDAAALEQLQSLLIGSELSAFHGSMAVLKQRVDGLEDQLYEPAALLKLLPPRVTELLTHKLVMSKEELVQAIAPIIDQAIQSRGEQDKVAMSSALSPLMAAAISQQTHHAPEDVALAIAPTLGKAIKEQIRLEQDAMVDALYPIIGSTIAKYMAEALQSINQQIENTLSPEGIGRKIRAKVQGVSEAELILKQAMPFTVQTIFLIHKASGLLIAEIQRASNHSLESELVAGMLTAIRSFANDCMATAGTTSELDQIDYGGAKIILEVAGYCYLAVVVQGEPPRSFMPKLRQTFSTLVKQYGTQLETFDGDPETIPAAATTDLEVLRDHFSGDRPSQSAKPPVVLIGLLGFVGLLGIPLGIYHYHQSVARAVESKTALALVSTPSLAVYRLDVTVSHGALTLAGRLPNPALRWQAEQIVRGVAPDWRLENNILAVTVPPDPTLTTAEVKRVTEILNQTEGTAITARYDNGCVVVEGTRNETIAAKTITQAFAQIPGVQSVTNTIEIQPLQLSTRFFFNMASATLQPVDRGYKLKQVITFLQQHPHHTVRLLGHSDRLSNPAEDQSLALRRAIAVREALVERGVASSRLDVLGAERASKEATLAWQRRSVALEPIAPVAVP